MCLRFYRFAFSVVALSVAVLPLAAQNTSTSPAAPPEVAPAAAPPAPAPMTSSATVTVAPGGKVVAAPTKAAAPAKSPTPAKPATASKGGLFSHKEKQPYTGPTNVIELPPAPMLDAEGKQRLDTNDKPMFFPPVKQQRDKYGHPLFDEKGKPVFQTATELGYDEHGKKLHVEKEKPPKTTPVSISRGVYTVDGMPGKAALNYDIPDLKYIYMFAPGIGIAVISREPFPGATLEKGAFNNNLLSVSVEGHTLELANDKRLLGKDPEDAYVMLDRTFVLPSRSPVIGYGTTLKAPYAWPGSKMNAKIAGLDAPPPPKALMPTLLLAPCPTGQMRMPAPVVLPGEKAPDQPCVPIAKAVAAAPAKK